jgi:hypothetical protein
MSAATEAQRNATMFARATRVEVIAAALSASFTLDYAPTMAERIAVVHNVLEAADAVDAAIANGTLNPHPHGVICPDCGKWADRPGFVCVDAAMEDDKREARRRTACAQRTEQQIRAIVRDEIARGAARQPWSDPNHDVGADLRRARDESRTAYYSGELDAKQCES